VLGVDRFEKPSENRRSELFCAAPRIVYVVVKRLASSMALMLRRSPMKLLEEFARKTVQKKPGLHSNRAQKGMYAGKDVRYGNTITFSAKKNRRRWLPNVQSKRLWSEMLNE
jgi:Ribosomal L28 family